MKGKVKVNGSAPKDGPKPVEYAQIDKQGRIPYGKTADAPYSDKRMEAGKGRVPSLPHVAWVPQKRR